MLRERLRLGWSLIGAPADALARRARSHQLKKANRPGDEPGRLNYNDHDHHRSDDQHDHLHHEADTMHTSCRGEHAMINKRAAPGSQVHARNCFASETAAQRFDRRINAAEQKARQRDAKNRDAGQSSFWLFIHLRKAELQKLFILRHLGSDQLPDDDAGQDYLQIIADHLCQLGADYLRWWARDHAPWASEEYIENVIMQTRDGKQWK